LPDRHIVHFKKINKSMEMETGIIDDYINAINSADIDKICDLLTDDFIFIDSQDNRVVGINPMRTSWMKYFELFPDYKIEINKTIVKYPMICLFGYASGTYKNLKNKENSNYWRIPAAWAAVIEGNRIKQWQVYADNIIVMDIINRNKFNG